METTHLGKDANRAHKLVRKLKQRKSSNHKEPFISKKPTNGRITFKNLVKEGTFKSVSESDKLIIIHKSKTLI